MFISTDFPLFVQIDSTDGVVSYEESLSGLVEGLAVMCAGDLTAVMATASSIYLLRISGSHGCLHRMPERDCSSSWGRLLEKVFKAAGQMAYGKKSESFYVAHKRGVTKIREDDDAEIRTPSAYGLAIDEKENVYFASYDGSEIFKAGGSLFSITETVCKGLDGVRHLFYDSQSGLLYFTEKKAVRTVQVKTPFALLDARLRKDLRRLIDSDDIPVQDQATFLVEGKRIRVSKTILCLRSEYFKTMFQSGFAESQANASPISISDTTYDAFYALVVFIVTGRFVVKDSSKYLLDVLTLSDRYLVQDVKVHCSKMLVDFAGDNLETVLNYACLAERHGFQELFDACLDSIVPELKHAYRLEAFKNLSKEALLEVVSRSIEKNWL